MVFNSHFVFSHSVLLCHSLAVLHGFLEPQEVAGKFYLFFLPGQERNTARHCSLTTVLYFLLDFRVQEFSEIFY